MKSPSLVGPELLELDAVLGLVDLVGAVVFTVDAETLSVKMAGTRAAERLGLPTETATDEGWLWEGIPEGPRSEVLDLVRAVAADRVPRVLEHPLRVGGIQRWLRTAFKAVDYGARPTLLGVMLDITAAHDVEMQWMELESWIIALGDTMPLDFWICDRDGRCVLQNPVSQARRGNLLGTRDGSWDRCIAEALRGVRTNEEVVAQREGRELHFVRIVSPIEREGSIQGALGIEVDVTELKEAERRLERLLQELRETQDSLVRKKQLAAMGEMSAVVAHEVRNPLGAIANAVALLSRSVGRGGGDAQLCRIIDEEVKRLDRLVTSLLDSVRPMSADLSPGVLGAVVDGALAQAVRADGRANDIRVERTIDSTLSEVPLDARLLEMALRNVFQNALQAMPETGDLFVDVAREVDGEREWARVTVRDSGPGLSAELGDRIFEPFSTTRASGSGLGLTIVRRVLEAHHGTVSLASEAGRGVTCVLRLPARQSEG